MNPNETLNLKSKKRYYKLLTIAGSDSSGGAGIQADLKTFSALGCYGMSVITALTAQNTVGVRGIYPIPPSFVEKQMEAVFTDIDVDAVKIGMLYSAELIESVASMLKKFKATKIVLDPVMAAQSGDSLMKSKAVDALKKHLMPLVDVVTPNIPETSALTGKKILCLDEMYKAARVLAQYGSKGIFIKGGHLENKESIDVLYIDDQDKFVTFKEKRIKTRNNHGTGCTLSSALASFLAKGNSIEAAAEKAKIYISKAIRKGSAYLIGKGSGPVHHFFEFWH